MNKLKLFLSVMSVLFFSLNVYAQNVYNADELNCDDSGYYITKEGQPVTGVVKSYYENGNLEAESNWKDGKQNGIAKWYYENGKLSMNIIL